MVDIICSDTTGNRSINNIDFIEVLEWFHEQVIQIVAVTQQGVAEDKAEFWNGTHALIKALGHLLVHVQGLQ